MFCLIDIVLFNDLIFVPDISADCGLPTIIKYSTLSPGGNLQGDKRTYTCASSTVQEGNPVIECLSSGMWSQTDLYCRRK